MLNELLKKIITGQRDGEPLWKIPLGEIRSQPLSDPAEGVLVAALAENILRCGLLSPILLRREEGSDGRTYSLIAGRRRLEAVRMLGRTHIQAIVVKCSDEQAPLLTLSENLVRHDPDYITLAGQLLALESAGWTADRLAAVFALRPDRIDGLRRLVALPADQLRTIRLLGLSIDDALAAADCPDGLRPAVLQKCLANPTEDAGMLIRSVRDTGDIRLTQHRKVMVSGIRAFQNTVEKAISTMQAAGFDTRIAQDEADDSYTYTVRVAKRQGDRLDQPAAAKTDSVLRETLSPPRRFSAALNIFEALADDECSMGWDVSRETSTDGLSISSENAEKLELCIDG